ncbi:thiamine-phosphate kinase [Paeniglutamicibacter cryotolerans]
MPADEQSTVGKLGESGLLARILPRLRGAQALLGPGDDAAMIGAPDGRFVFSVDTLVQDQDFRLTWASGYSSSGYDVGWKSAAQNLSDINAMGAVATAAVISLTLPHETPVGWVEDLADGFSAAVRELGAMRCAIAGGDLGRGREISITAAVTGDLAGAAPLLRSGARPGDVVAVCGILGAGAAGLALLESSRGPGGWNEQEARLVGLQARPRPPLAAGPAAAAAGATAMMDLSDGLGRDGARLAAASGVVLALESAALAPDALALEPVAGGLGVEALTWVLGGGEDHGLLATFGRDVELPSGFRQIGDVVAGTAGGCTIDGAPLGAFLGYDHFGG